MAKRRQKERATLYALKDVVLDRWYDDEREDWGEGIADATKFTSYNHAVARLKELDWESAAVEIRRLQLRDVRLMVSVATPVRGHERF